MAKAHKATILPAMRDNPQTWFDESLEILTYNRNQRVWSILVTILATSRGVRGIRSAAHSCHA